MRELENFRKYLTEKSTSQDLDKAMQQGLSKLNSIPSDLNDEDLSTVVKEQKEILTESITGLVIGGVLAAPKILQWIGTGVGAIAKFFTGNESEIAKWIEEKGEKWEKFYVKSISFVVRKTGFASAIWKKDGVQNDNLLYATSKVIYGIILAAAAGQAISGAITAASPIFTALEGVLGGVKVVEIVGIIPKVKQAIS